LDEDIQVWNLELALVRCIYRYLDAQEFGIGNIPIPSTTGIRRFAERQLICRVSFFGHSAKKVFA
jgi:hypothetical protein